MLLAALESNPAPQNSDVWPVLYAFRHAIEFHLKPIVLGEGGNFLPTKPDHISVSKTHSVSWLAQFVSQIVTVLKWEHEFKCEGVENLADFKAIVESINSVELGSHALQCPVDPQSQVSIRDFARKIDALLHLLDSTGDALAVEWDARVEGIKFGGSGNGGPGGTTMIQ